MTVLVTRYEVWDWLLGTKSRVGEYASRVDAIRTLHSVRAYYRDWCDLDAELVDLHVFLVMTEREEQARTGEELDD